MTDVTTGSLSNPRLDRLDWRAGHPRKGGGTGGQPTPTAASAGDGEDPFIKLHSSFSGRRKQALGIEYDESVIVVARPSGAVGLLPLTVVIAG